MKFSSSANIALATIALSSPNLLSSPAFVHAAPTMETASLSPNPGTGYLGNSPHLSATESPVLKVAPALAGTPPARKIAGRRRSSRRANLVKTPSKEHLNRSGAINGDALGLGSKNHDALGLEVPGTSQRVAMPSTSALGHIPIPTVASDYWAKPNDVLGMIPPPGSAIPAGVIPLSAPTASVPKPADVVEGVQASSQTITTPTLNSMSGNLPNVDPNLRVPRDLLPEHLVGGLLNLPPQHGLPSVVNPNEAPVLDDIISALPELPAPALSAVSAAKGAIIPARPRAVSDSAMPLDPLTTMATPLLPTGGQLLNTGLLAPPNSPILGANEVLQNVGPMGSIPVVDQLGSLPHLDPTVLDTLLPPAAVPALPTGGLVPEASGLPVPGANGLPAIPGLNNLPVVPSGGGLLGKASLPVVPGAIGLASVPGATGVAGSLLASTAPSVGLPVPGVAAPGVNGLPVNPSLETGLPAINSLPISPLTGSVPTLTVPSAVPAVDPTKLLSDPPKVVPTSIAPLPGASGVSNPVPLDSLPVTPLGHGPIEDITKDTEARVPASKRAAAEPTLPTVTVTDVDTKKQPEPGQPESTTERGNTTDELPIGAETEDTPEKRPGFRYQIGDWDGDEYDYLHDEEIRHGAVEVGQENETQTSSSAGFVDSPTLAMDPTRTMMAMVDATETVAAATGNPLAVTEGLHAITRAGHEVPTPVSIMPLPTRIRMKKDAKPTTTTYRWGPGPQRRAWMSRRRLGLAPPGLADEAGPLPTDAAGIPTAVTRPLPILESGALATAAPAVDDPASAARPTSEVAQLATESIPAPTSNFGSSALTALLSPPSGSPALPVIQPGSFGPGSGSLLPTPSVNLPRSASLVTLRSVSMVSIASEPLDTATASAVPAEIARATTSELGNQVAPVQTESVRPTQTSFVVPTQAALHHSSPGHQANPAGLGSNPSFDSVSSGSDASAGPTAIVLTKPATSQSTLPPETHATGSPLSRVNERSHTLSGPSRLRTLLRSVVTPTSTVAITGKDSDTPTSTGSVPSPTGSGTGTKTASSDMGATRSIFRLRVPSAVTSTVRSVVTGRKSRL